MSAPRWDDILVATGGEWLVRHGVPFVRRRFDLTEPGKYTHTRADASTCASLVGRSGSQRLAAANALRPTWDTSRDACGLLLEPAATNVVLYNRDLTNAAWVKTDVSAAKDQTGVDGVASSASKITASAGNGTCLQAITLASSDRYQTAYVKRVTGSGTVEMTMDNGATWTAITVTSSWTRVAIPTQTLANPTVGFRIVTSGDAIAVDLVQNENRIYPTSPIPTTSAAVTRAADALSLPIGFGPEDLTAYVRIARPAWADLAGTFGNARGLYKIGGGSAYAQLFAASASRQITAQINGANSATRNIPAGSALEVCCQFANWGTAPISRIDVGDGSGFTASATGSATAAFGAQTLLVGSVSAGTELNGAIERLLIARGLFTLAEMQAAPLP